MSKSHSGTEQGFHLVNPSIWPFFASFSVAILAFGGVLFMHEVSGGVAIIAVGLLLTLYNMFSWWSDVIRESRQDRAHNWIVQKGLRIGMVFFIASEAMFFFAFFMSLVMSHIFPAGILDGVWVVKEGVWPPESIETLSAWEVPLLNTLILLLSGTTLTWAHHSLIHGNRQDMITALQFTIFLGGLFTAFQAYEYHHASFGIKDGIYGSNFYLATGFHGLHVIIGTLFLTVCLFRAKRGHFDEGNNHLGFEFAAWYWHFVDVVWLLLFVLAYIWQ